MNQSLLTEVLERVAADLPSRDRGADALRRAASYVVGVAWVRSVHWWPRR